MKTTLLILILSFGANALALDLGECAQELSFDVSTAGITGDFVGQQPLRVAGKKIVINDKAAIISHEIKGEFETYKYKVQIYGSIFEERTLTVRKTADGYNIIRNDDLNAQKQAAKKAGFYSMAQENYPMDSGIEKQYQTKSGKCTLSQAMVLKTVRSKDSMKEVYVDKKYCDSITELTKTAGKDAVQSCVNVLEKAGQAYFKRQGELATEGKTFSQLENGLMGAAVKLAMCSPMEQKIRLESLNLVGGGMNGTMWGSGMSSGAMASGGMASGMMSTGGSMAPTNGKR